MKEKRNGRWRFLLLTVVMLGGVLAGCNPEAGLPAAGGDNEPDAVSTATESENQTEPAGKPAGVRDTIIIATENETPTLHTAEINAVASDYMNRLTHNGLFVQNMQMEPVPDLVESYENLNDLQWQFRLREGILFHNGAEMTSEDVKATFDWNKQFSECLQYTKSIEDVEIIDRYSFIINTNGIQATILNDLCHHSNFIVPKALIDIDHDFNAEPIGSGPYQFVEWKRGDSLTFVKFDDYFDKEHMPSITNMIWKIIPEGTSRTIALENGEVDLVIEVATADIPRLQDNENIEVLMTSGTAHHYIMLNNDKPPLDNQLFRKALCAAVDRQACLEVGLDGLGEVSITQTPTAFAAMSLENALDYDIELALALLEQSGVDANGLEIELIASNESKKRVSEVIQHNLAALGIKVEIVQMDLATYLDVTTTMDYTASNGGFNASELLGYMKGVHHSASIGASNRSRLNSPELDSLIDKAIVTLDAEERTEILREACALVNDLCPGIPLYQETVKRAFNADLMGVEVNPAGLLLYKNVYWKE